MIFRLELWVLRKIINFSSKTKQKFKFIDILHIKLMLVNINEYFNFKKVKNCTPHPHLDLKSRTGFTSNPLHPRINSQITFIIFLIYAAKICEIKTFFELFWLF